MSIRRQIDQDVLNRAVGVKQVFVKTITSAANAGVVTVGTVATNPIVIESAVIHANAAQTVDMTSCGLYGGTGQVITIIDPAVAVQANLDATDKQVSTGHPGPGGGLVDYGPWRLAAAKTVAINLIGTGPTAVNLTVILTYHASVAGGYLV